MSEEETETFEIHLSGAQLLKLKKGLPFQLNSSQLSSGTTGHKVSLTTHRKHYRRMLTNIKNKRGFRFSSDIVKGGSVWDVAKGAWNVIKHHGAKVVDAVKKHAPKVAKFIKDNIPKETIANIVSEGVDSIAPKKVRGLAKRVAEKAVNYGYETGAKSGLEHAKDIATSLTPEIKEGVVMATPKRFKSRVNNILNVPPVEGEGLRHYKKKILKGSPEAKAWGEKMRALRGKKTSGCGLADMVKVIAPIAIPAIQKAITGRGFHNKVPYSALADGIPSPIITEASAERIMTHGLKKNLHQ